jgi:hypothetical protein
MDMDDYVPANPELEEEKETPPAAPTEEETSEKDEGSQPKEKIVEEEKVPYHKDPRWIEMYEASKEAKAMKEDYEQTKAKLAELEERNKEPEKPEEIPSGFMGSEEDWHAWQEREKRLMARAEEAVIKRLEDQKVEAERAKQEEVAGLTNYFQSEMDLLKEDFNFDESKLKDYVVENKVVDSQGVFDLKRGLMKMLNVATKPNPARKEAADLTGSDRKPESPKRDFATSEDFQGGARPW